MGFRCCVSAKIAETRIEFGESRTRLEGAWMMSGWLEFEKIKTWLSQAAANESWFLKQAKKTELQIGADELVWRCLGGLGIIRGHACWLVVMMISIESTSLVLSTVRQFQGQKIHDRHFGPERISR